MNFSRIGQYYDTTSFFYSLYARSTHGFHLGYHDGKTLSQKQAILNVNKFVAQQVKVKDGDMILDAGCGIGGTAFWLARNFGIKVVGITASEKQVATAKKLAKKYGLEDKTEFHLMDFTKTTFKNDTFDIVFAIESACYAKDKIDFLKEAYRVLKKGGRLVVVDGFLENHPTTQKDMQFLNDYYQGYQVDNFAQIPKFKEDMLKAGFKNIKFWDKRKEVTPSVNRMYYFLLVAYPVALLLHKLGLLPKIVPVGGKSGIFQKYLFDHHLIAHCAFYGEK